ncbi:MAG: adenylyltransferase/cytidyltransferase family protein, partial [Dehalococcoidia bacterium]
MTVEEELAQVQPSREMCLTIGVFDGVHPGHQYLIKNVMERAARENRLSGVVTFDRHPNFLLNPASELPCLTSLEERVDITKRLGIDYVVVLSFTHQLAQLTAREFVRLLHKHLRMRDLVVGPDFALGKGREGNTDMLRSLGEELGFTVVVLSSVTTEGLVVSSTAIREHLRQGNVETVTKMLGRRFRMSGVVTHG